MRNNLIKIALAATLALALVFIFGCSSDKDDGNTPSPGTGNAIGPCTDGVVPIGTQIWQKCNSNVVPNTGTHKCYDNKAANCEKYGRLYDFEAAKKACPPDWHLPSNADWDELITYVESDKGCTECAGKHLKDKNGWDDDNGKSGNGLDSYDFAALPGGRNDGTFRNVGIIGIYWSADEYYKDNSCFSPSKNEEDESYTRNMLSKNDGAWAACYNKGYLFSVRCVKD